MSAKEITHHIDVAAHDQGIISSLVIGATLAGLLMVITMSVAAAVAPVIDTVRAIV